MEFHKTMQLINIYNKRIRAMADSRRLGFSFNQHTYICYMVTFSFNLMATVCVIAHLFFIDQNDIIVHYSIFPNVGVYHATFPNLKGPRALSQNCKKIPAF